MVRTPAVRLRSLIAVGTPSSGGSVAGSRCRDLLLGLLGPGQRVLGGDRDERAQLGVAALDPGQVVLDQLDRADLARAHRRGLLQRGHVVQLRHATRPYPGGRRGDDLPDGVRPRVRTRKNSTGPTRWPASRPRASRRAPGGAVPGRQLARPAAPVHRRPARPVVAAEWGGGLVRSWSSWIGLARADRRPDRDRRCSVPGRARWWSPTRPRSTSTSWPGRRCAARPGALGGAVVAGRLPDRPLRAAGVVRGARADAAGPPDRHRRRGVVGGWSSRAGLLGRGGGALARGVPVGGVAGPTGGSPRWRTRPARWCCGTCRTRAGRCRSGCPPPAWTWRWAVRTSTSTAGRGRRPTCTCGAELQESLQQPIQGWFGSADQFAMGPVYSPGPGIDRFLRRHAAGAVAGRGRGRGAGCWPRPGSSGCGPRGRR